MKKVLIQTCFINNYGACLQAYALQSVINNFHNTKSYIIPFDRYPDLNLNFSRKVRRLLKLVKYFRKPIYYQVIDDIKFERAFNFFRKKYLLFYKVHKLTRDKKFFLSLNYDCKYFVCGSDIIWNPNLKKDNLWYDMLGFCKDNSIRIAYAPSFGISVFPNDLIPECSQYLFKFNYLSCREDSGVKIIRDQFQLNSEHVLDPTLLLTNTQWKNLCLGVKPNKKNKYCFIYMFSKMPIKEIVDKILFDTDLDIEIIPFGNVDESLFNDRVHKNKSNTGPLEFVSLISNAKLVIANSLHALAFSINLNTPFIIFNRDNYDPNYSINSRLTSMLNMFNFSDRLIDINTFLNGNIYSYLEQNFILSNKILKENRIKCVAYLKDALDV